MRERRAETSRAECLARERRPASFILKAESVAFLQRFHTRMIRISAMTAPPCRNSEAKITSRRVGTMTSLLFFQEEDCCCFPVAVVVAAVGSATRVCCSCLSRNLHIYRSS